MAPNGGRLLLLLLLALACGTQSNDGASSSGRQNPPLPAQEDRTGGPNGTASVVSVGPTVSSTAAKTGNATGNSSGMIYNSSDFDASEIVNGTTILYEVFYPESEVEGPPSKTQAPLPTSTTTIVYQIAYPIGEMETYSEASPEVSMDLQNSTQPVPMEFPAPTPLPAVKEPRESGVQPPNATSVQSVRPTVEAEVQKEIEVEVTTPFQDVTTIEAVENSTRYSMEEIRQMRALKLLPYYQAEGSSCITPSGQAGHCKNIQHCLRAGVTTFNNFLNSICVVDREFIGFCCPDNPVELVEVRWPAFMRLFLQQRGHPIQQPEGGCGVNSQSRIIGGTEADPNDYPWMVMLFYNSQMYCGGSLINNWYVLTAAHCTYVSRGQIFVRVGRYRQRNPPFLTPVEDIPVAQIKRHGLYGRLSLQNDIALLKLARPVQFGQYTGTICLPSNQNYVNETATVMGWGNVAFGGPGSNVLKQAEIQVLDNEECQRIHWVRRWLPSTMCAGSRDGNHGACNGDSGGPLMVLKHNRWTVIGIVSWGRLGCNTAVPVAFTRVSSYLEWIALHSSA